MINVLSAKIQFVTFVLKQAC